jgi:UrcA family protein
MTIRPLTRAAIAVACLALPALPILAQERAMADPPDDDGEIVVEAPRKVAAPQPPGERSTSTGAPLMTLTMRIPVLFGDLDLRRPEDGERLMTRIQNVASFACNELDRAYPLTSDPDCVRHATTAAREAARTKIRAKSGQ